METRTREVVVFDTEKEGGLPPFRIIEFKAWLDSILAKIPTEHMPEAFITFDAEEAYGNPFLVVTAGYTRPETPEERAAIERSIQISRDSETRRELAEFERLKAKYPQGLNPHPSTPI